VRDGAGAPRNVGPYAIEGVLGQGGMGTVLRARAPDGAPIALKIVRSSLTTRDALDRFEREARIRIAHPNVVAVLDAGADHEGSPYIALELLDGRTLAERLRDEGTLSAAEILEIGIQACAGLEAAHRFGVIHRDLKPSNIFCCRDGVVKLLDFGVASLRDAETRLTETGHVLGTLYYLAPEQAEGSARLDARTDVWALGAVLFEALAGRPPFREESALATVVATMLAELPSLRALRPDVPPALESVIVRALRKRPAERWSSAEEMRLGLERARDQPSDVERTAALRHATIPPDEQRIVALLYAKGVTDLAAVERAVRQERGIPIPLPEGQVLGLFGAETTVGDEVARAASAAVRCRAAVSGIAVSSGRATSTPTAIAGSALDAAQTTLSLAIAGIAISSEAVRGLPASAPLSPIREGVLELDASPRTLEVLADAPDDVELLGRDIEVAQIGRAIGSVLAEGRAGAIWITGPPGIGKSRLRAEAELLLDRSEPRFERLFARAEPRHGRQDLGLFRALLATEAERREWTLSEAPLALARSAFSSAAEIARCAEAFRLLLPLRESAELSTGSMPTDLQSIDDRIQLALLEWVLALARKGPLALVLEDAHWASRSSLALLERIRDHAFEHPLLVIATARSELFDARPELFVGESTTHLPLRGLTAADVRRIAERVLGSAAPVRAEWIQEIARQTDGNPFFVEQIVRGRGEHLSVDEEHEQPLPWTVEAALQARLDHLMPNEKDLCRRAAILGRPFTPAELAALGARDPRPLVQALRRRGLFSPRGEDRYDFSSAMLGEAAYRMLTDTARTSLHARAAEVLSSAPGADPEEIAQHHERGGAAAPAAEAYLRALSAASARGDAQTVLRTSDAALGLGIAEDRVHDVRMARADALRFLGQRDDQLAELADALAHARTDAQRARALSEQCVAASRRGRSEEALALGHEAIEAARRSGEPLALTLALGRSLLAMIQLGRVSEAAPLLEETIAYAALCDTRTRAMVCEYEGQLAGALGDLETRRRAFVRAAELHRQVGDLRRAAGAESNLADADNRFGAYAAAARALSEARDACRKVGHHVMEGYTLVNLGYALTRLGEPERALVPLGQATEIAQRLGEVRLACAASVYRARALLALGHAEESAALAEGAAAEASARRMPSVEITALTIAADARLSLGDAEAALALSTRAVERMDEIGGVEEDEIEVRVTHARAADATGRQELADATRRAARARLAQLASAIVDPELRRAFLTDVPAHRALSALR
jgi:tetratricopeptide (TPR) repeat protein